MNTSTFTDKGLVELQSEETERITGGFVILVVLATAYVSIVLFQSMENPKRILDGFLDSLS